MPMIEKEKEDLGRDIVGKIGNDFPLLPSRREKQREVCAQDVMFDDGNIVAMGKFTSQQWHQLPVYFHRKYTTRPRGKKPSKGSPARPHFEYPVVGLDAGYVNNACEHRGIHKKILA